MITRSDLQICGGSPTDFESLNTSQQMDATMDYQMDHSDIQYTETEYPASIYELSQDGDSHAKDDCVSAALNTIVNDMLTPPDTMSSHGFGAGERRISCYDTCAVKEELSTISYAKEDTSRTASSSSTAIRPEKLMMSIKDEFMIKDEFEALHYSQHPDASSPESTTHGDTYSNPICQIENIPFSNPYDDDADIKCDPDDRPHDTKPTCLEQRNYDTSSLMYGTDDMTTFTGLVNCDEVLRSPKRKDHHFNGTIVCCYRSGSSPPSSSDEGRSTHPEQAEKEKEERDDNFFCQQETMVDESNESRKGKISGLQRRALDCIFSVTDRPSRGLVLHIAGELCLHHITVKNFFSNGRRRLRRAAARLSDPERTRRENQKRKEKRRLAALAVAACTANGDKGGAASAKGCSDGGGDAQSPRDPPVLSPERRALMEKLAVKVQRSVAQKGLAGGNLGDSICLLNKGLTSPTTPYNQNHFSPQSLDNPMSTQLHSNPIGLNEHSYLNQNGEEFGAIFSSYPESEPMSSYDSSPDQNSVNVYSSEQDNADSYDLLSQEGGPYSPTSWQTLLHT